MPSLPTPGGDAGTWGAELNEFLEVSHNADGSLLASAIALVTATTESGTTYTLELTDAGNVVELTSASSVTVTVPPNASVAFPTGTVVGLHQYGAGQVTVAAGSGVTIRSPNSYVDTATQYSSAFLRKRGTNEWVLGGDLTG
jgi:hypothetical protein